MANTRRRTSGFESKPFEVIEEENSEVHEETADSHEVETPVAEEKPFVEETIVPMEDFGPRFIEVAEPAEPKPEPERRVKSPELSPRPKRNPRNVPRFSRTR